MAMRFIAGLGVMLSVSSFACSGKYYEVGSRDPATVGSSSGGTQSAAGSAAGGAAAGNFGFAGEPTTAGGSQVVTPVGGTSAVGPGGPLDEFGPQCVPSGQPAQLAGAFATPGVVWNRLAMLIWGKPAGPPGVLPAATTYAWASEVVDLGFADVTAKVGTAIGAGTFVLEWLNLGRAPGEDPGLLGHYDRLLGGDAPALEILLRVPLGETGRVGVFSEPKWLALNPEISSRGEAMMVRVFRQSIPPPPPGFENPPLDPTLPDREALAKAISSPPCSSCHNLMDNPGYALGHFGADGAYRELDHGEPIDTTGVISRAELGTIMFDGIADFGSQFAGRCSTTRALADGFLEVALNLAGFSQEQQQTLFDANQARVQQAFIAGGRSYPALVKAFAQSPAVLRP